MEQCTNRWQWYTSLCGCSWERVQVSPWCRASGATHSQQKNNSALFQYLRNVSCDSQFATSVLQTLLEERRTMHRERWNKDRTSHQFAKGDVVKAHIQVQSKSVLGEVGTLSYRARGPFQIVEVLGNDSYHVQRYNDTDSSIRKYKGTDLYILPPAIFPCEPLDTMDVR